MSRVAAIGQRHRVEGFGLAGVLVVPADDAETACGAWTDLPQDVDVVVLTGEAAAAITPWERDDRLWVVLPT